MSKRHELKKLDKQDQIKIIEGALTVAEGHSKSAAAIVGMNYGQFRANCRYFKITTKPFRKERDKKILEVAQVMGSNYEACQTAKCSAYLLRKVLKDATGKTTV